MHITDVLIFIYLQGSLVMAMLGVGWCWAALMRRAERMKRLSCKRGSNGAQHTTSYDSHAVMTTAASSSGSVSHRKALHAPNDSQMSGEASACKPDSWCTHGVACHPSLMSACTSHGTSHSSTTKCSGSASEPGASHASHQHLCHLPGVSVVMPVKGCKPHSVHNWGSQVSMHYDGFLEFLFVVDSTADPAWLPLQQLREGHPDKNIKVVVAGHTETCSQKIHNQLCGAGAASPGQGYVLFLDDDVELHPGALQELVGVMEADKKLFMATGYPFDIPPPGASLSVYCVLVYHTPLLIAFSVKQRTSFVWGGCMMLRAEALAPHDPHGVAQAWHCGGYSDDLVLASVVTEQGLAIAVPSSAIFPQWLDKRVSWRQYFNYLHRQLYVLDTYTNRHNRTINHTMMGVHSWASISFVAPIAASAWRALLPALAALVRIVRQVSAGPPGPHPHPQGASPEGGEAVGSSGAGGANHWRSLWETTGDASAATWSGGDIALFVFLVFWLFAHCGVYWMSAEVLALLRALDPKRSPKALSLSTFSWLKLWVALVVENSLVPLFLAYTALCPAVEWGGVTYHKKGGKVRAVARRQA